jgi:hypothetical protein
MIGANFGSAALLNECRLTGRGPADGDVLRQTGMKLEREVSTVLATLPLLQSPGTRPICDCIPVVYHLQLTARRLALIGLARGMGISA